jgi:FMN phosphatase YigB (HAD superfamily)
VLVRCDSCLATNNVLQEEALKRMIQQAVDAKERARLEAECKALEEKLRRQEEERQRQEEARRVREEELRRDQLKREELNRQGACPAGFAWLKVQFVLC